MDGRFNFFFLLLIFDSQKFIQKIKNVSQWQKKNRVYQNDDLENN